LLVGVTWSLLERFALHEQHLGHYVVGGAAVETVDAPCRNAEPRLTEMVTRLEPVPDRPRIDLGSLYDGNLISGVVSGLE
jgi:hypothetical protein